MNGQEWHFVQEHSSIPRRPLITRMDYDGSQVLIYNGLARRGSATSDEAWLIEKMFYNADGTLAYTLMSDFNQIWDNRASITYS